MLAAPLVVVRATVERSRFCVPSVITVLTIVVQAQHIVRRFTGNVPRGPGGYQFTTTDWPAAVLCLAAQQECAAQINLGFRGTRRVLSDYQTRTLDWPARWNFERVLTNGMEAAKSL